MPTGLILHCKKLYLQYGTTKFEVERLAYDNIPTMEVYRELSIMGYIFKSWDVFDKGDLEWFESRVWFTDKFVEEIMEG